MARYHSSTVHRLGCLVLVGAVLHRAAAQPRDGEPPTFVVALGAGIAAAAELAEWGAVHGYATEAGAGVRRLLRVVPGHHSAGLLRKIAEGAAAEDGDATQSLRRRHAVEYAAKLAALRAAL